MTTLAEARERGIEKMLAERRAANLARRRAQLVHAGEQSACARAQRVEAFDARVLNELAAGPRAVACIVRAIDSYDNQVKSALRRLAQAGKAVIIGTAFDFGRADLHQRALIWALAGTPALAKRAISGPSKRKQLAPSVPKLQRAQHAPNPERMAGWRTIGRGLVGWGGWGNWT